MNNYLEIAKSAALEAGNILINTLEKSIEIGYKSAGFNNPFSEADKKSESLIVEKIRGHFPTHRIITEESDATGGDSDYTWIIDPLDGTVNYIHGHRYFAVSIALARSGELITGVIYNPNLNELYWAEKGGGAFLNGKLIKTSGINKLDKSLVYISFPYEHSSEFYKRTVEYSTRLELHTQAFRRDGSIALALSNIACGRYDGFCALGSEVWDYAAGILLVNEAGGRATDPDDRPFTLDSRQVIVTNGIIHREMLDLLA